MTWAKTSFAAKAGTGERTAAVKAVARRSFMVVELKE